MKSFKNWAIFWFLITLLWIVTTILVIVDQDEWWRIALNIFVAILSLVNAILNYRNYKKNK